MPIIDIVLLICFIPAIISGLSKGLVRQITGLFSLLIGAWAAFTFSASLGLWLGSFINAEEGILKIIAFVAIILVVYLVLALVGKILSRILKAIYLGWLNRLLGLIFGVLKTLFVLGLLIMLFESAEFTLHFLEDDTIAQLDNAMVYNFIKDFTQAAIPAIKSFVLGADV